jgi:CPA1 family monovalent cation:H+ antiporter
LPHRVSVILEGEALLNDASALLIYRLAVTAVLAGGNIGANAVAPAFLVSLFGSVIAGLVLAWVVGQVTRRVEDAPSSIIVQFVSTYGVWVLAEHAGLSPILTMVSYAMTLARSAPAYLPARLRIPSYAVWDTAVLVLNVLAFLVIGLELGPIIAAAKPGELGRWLWLGAAVLATVILVRLLWALAGALWAQWRNKHGAVASADGPVPSWRTGLIIGWAGTRGLVTVATALALPQTFPERGMLLFAAFTVTLGTLLIQGLTLRPLVLALRVPEDTTVEREVQHARFAIARNRLWPLSLMKPEAPSCRPRARAWRLKIIVGRFFRRRRFAPKYSPLAAAACSPCDGTASLETRPFIKLRKNWISRTLRWLQDGGDASGLGRRLVS